MAEVRAHLSPGMRPSFDRLMLIFLTLSCHLRTTARGPRYVFRAEYKGRHGETAELKSIPAQLVDVLIVMTSRLMEAEHDPRTLN